MDILRNQFRNLIRDKKNITFFTTLVNVNCLVYYILSKYCSKQILNVNQVLNNYNYLTIAISTVIDLLLCNGFVYLYFKSKSPNSFDSSEPKQSAIDTASIFKELRKGNILTSEIYSFDFVTNIEKNTIPDDEVWCITGDLEEDSKNTYLIETIQNNLKKGVCYRYFITRMGNEIAQKASLGMQTLTEAIDPKYRKRLFFYEIDQELIAPDIDIIIYKANKVNERTGFICVEIGDEDDTYIYQKMDRVTIHGICDKLTAYHTLEKKQNYLGALTNKLIQILRFFVNHFSILYLIASTGGLTIISFTKIKSITTALLFLIPSIIEFLITFILIIAILSIILIYQDLLNTSINNEKILSEFVDSEEIREITEKAKKNNLETLKKQKRLGDANQVLKIGDECLSIWILSNLSHDIANSEFYNWLTDNLDSHPQIDCHIIYIKNTETFGRFNKIKVLKDIYSQRIITHQVEDFSSHYIWSETYGIIFLDNGNKKHNVYISLGSADNSFYKEVITTEKEDSSLFGRLLKITGTELLS